MGDEREPTPRVSMGRETYSALKAMSKAHVDAERMRQAEKAEAAGDVDEVVRLFVEAQRQAAEETTKRWRIAAVVALALIGASVAAGGGTMAANWFGLIDLSFSGEVDAPPEEAP